LGCVEKHIKSIFQKSQNETPFDGRFAADVEGGEFLCPLCKQLSNVVIPAEIAASSTTKATSHISNLSVDKVGHVGIVKNVLASGSTQEVDEAQKKAIKQYGTYLSQGMQVSSRKSEDGIKKIEWEKKIHKLIKNVWDFSEDENSTFSLPGDLDPPIGNILRLLRQQHIAWAAAGYGASASEASTRGVKQEGFEPPTLDPWSDYTHNTRDTHPNLLELRRTISAASTLLTVLSDEMVGQLDEFESDLNFKKRTTRVGSEGVYLEIFWMEDSSQIH
jgi:hypothetical protein